MRRITNPPNTWANRGKQREKSVVNKSLFPLFLCVKIISEYIPIHAATVLVTLLFGSISCICWISTISVKES